MMKRIVTGAVLLASAMSLSVMAAAPQTPEEKAATDVANRQAVFKLLSVANGPLGGMARGAPYNADAAKASLERLGVLAKMIPEVFAADTTAFKGVKTRASDTIWASKADFDKLAADLSAAVKAASDTVAAKGADGIKDAVAGIGPKCGACHDRFRLN